MGGHPQPQQAQDPHAAHATHEPGPDAPARQDLTAPGGRSARARNASGTAWQPEENPPRRLPPHGGRLAVMFHTAHAEPATTNNSLFFLKPRNIVDRLRAGGIDVHVRGGQRRSPTTPPGSPPSTVPAAGGDPTGPRLRQRVQGGLRELPRRRDRDRRRGPHLPVRNPSRALALFEAERLDFLLTNRLCDARPEAMTRIHLWGNWALSHGHPGRLIDVPFLGLPVRDADLPAGRLDRVPGACRRHGVLPGAEDRSIRNGFRCAEPPISSSLQGRADEAAHCPGRRYMTPPARAPTWSPQTKRCLPTCSTSARAGWSAAPHSGAGADRPGRRTRCWC